MPHNQACSTLLQHCTHPRGVPPPRPQQPGVPAQQLCCQTCRTARWSAVPGFNGVGWGAGRVGEQRRWPSSHASGATPARPHAAAPHKLRHPTHRTCRFVRLKSSNSSSSRNCSTLCCTAARESRLERNVDGCQPSALPTAAVASGAAGQECKGLRPVQGGQIGRQAGRVGVPRPPAAAALARSIHPACSKPARTSTHRPAAPSRRHLPVL